MNQVELSIEMKSCGATARARRESMRMLFICFANVARSQVAEHISKRSHNMICHNPGIAVDHLTRPNNLPSRKLKQVPFPQRPIDYINRAMDFLLRQIVTKTHFPILSGTPINLCNRLRIHAGPMPQRRSLLGFIRRIDAIVSVLLSLSD